MGDPKFDYWFGVEREKLDWHPTIDYDRCAKCMFCVALCGRGVYAAIDGKPVVVQPNHCLVGCTTCANMCPADAIGFPPKEKAKSYISVHKIWPKVKEIAEQKTEKLPEEVLSQYHQAMRDAE